MHDGVVFDYLNPDVPPGLRLLLGKGKDRRAHGVIV